MAGSVWQAREVHNILPGLIPLASDIDALHPMKGNARKGDVERVAASFRRFGQRKPVVARTDGTIEAGHHMHAAAVSLGWTEIAVVFVEESDEEAKAFNVADNRLGDLGQYDHELLLDQLVDLQQYDRDLLEVTGYDDDDIAALRALIGEEPPAQRAGNDMEVEPAVCPHCGELL